MSRKSKKGTNMPGVAKKRSRKSGLPPGTMVHIGEKRSEETALSLFDYDENKVTEKKIETVKDCAKFRDTATVTWINVDGLHQVDKLTEMGECFRLHPLVMEDIANTDQRPKMEDYGDYIYVVLRELTYKEDFESEQISLVLGKNFLLSFQERAGDSFGPVRERIRQGRGRIRKQGAGYLAYSLIDVIVDQYFSVLERIGERVEELEDEITESPTPAALNRVHALKRELIMLRKSVWPLREMVGAMERSESELLGESTVIYLRDVYDHVIQVIDTIETYREIVAGMLDLYLSSVSNRMNEVMKVLTIIATIFIPLTFVTGLYGMNFTNIPAADWKWGFEAVVSMTALIALTMVWLFRRRKWI